MGTLIQSKPHFRYLSRKKFTGKVLIKRKKLSLEKLVFLFNNSSCKLFLVIYIKCKWLSSLKIWNLVFGMFYLISGSNWFIPGEMLFRNLDEIFENPSNVSVKNKKRTKKPDNLVSQNLDRLFEKGAYDSVCSVR